MPVFDLHMMLSILGVAFIAGIIGLDRTAAGQFMISQPIVAGPLTGWILGDLTPGIVVGTALELIWVLDLPVGTFVPADATTGTMAATAIAALATPGEAPLWAVGFSILLTTAMVPATMTADRLIRVGNSKLADRVLEAGGADMAKALTRTQLTGLAFFFLKSFVLCCVFIPLGIAALVLFGRMPGVFHDAMMLYVKLLPLVGIAVVARKLSMMTFDRYILIGFAVAAVSGQLAHAPVLIVLVLAAAAGVVGAEYRERRS
jgi:PTS system mannose-specific IIC component